MVHELELDNVRLVGVLREDDPLRRHRWADVFILPLGKKGMLKAIAVSLPVVLPVYKGTRETLGETGILAAPNPQSLWHLLDRVARDARLRAEVSRWNLLRARSTRGLA